MKYQCQIKHFFHKNTTIILKILIIRFLEILVMDLSFAVNILLLIFSFYFGIRAKIHQVSFLADFLVENLLIEN